MKSLTLNLLNSLLLLFLLPLLAVAVATATTSSTATTSLPSSSSSSASNKKYNTVISASNRGLPSTTPKPPSLQAPPQLQLRRHTLPATVATSKPLQMASRSSSRQRLPLASRHAQTTTKTPSTFMTNSKTKPIITETSTLASTRLVRHAADATTPANVLRQHRSFQTNGAQPYDDAETKRKTYKTLERLQYLRSSNVTASSTTTTTTTTSTTTPQPSTTTSSSTLGKSQVSWRQRTPPPPFHDSSTIHRQSKQQQSSSLLLPLADDDHSKTKLTTTTTSLHNQQTPKTPRMIQRLVAGHIQNAEGRSTYQVSSVTTNSTTSNSTIAAKLSSTQYGQRRPAMLSSSYRNTKLNANIRIAAAAPTTTTKTTTHNEDHHEDYHDDDEALLDDPGDFDNWDNGILRLSAGSGKENNLKPKKNKEDTKKTLADQVRDGKYGLIEKELFRRAPKRPGVLSYLPNKEVPEDNEHNYGGLNEEDIWLAEDHLLVIKGGSLNEDNPNEPWPAIDDYNAAGRQIKIPQNPKIPPPFPVQLEENGPVQLIGNNKLTVVYPVTNESLPVYTIGPQTHNTPSENDSDDEKNLITRPGKIKDAKENDSDNNYPSSALPWLYNNQTFVNPSLNAEGKPINFPILGPFLYGRNGSLDNINSTDDFDEDDPSLYYPPAYTFVYKSNYSNPVPPGPLVPGIVVPPPPEHFGKLEKSEKERKPWTSTQLPPVRYRVYSTTTSIPTTTTSWPTTTTTTTTTEQPFRQVITKISEYTPKIINIVTPANRPVYTPTQSPRVSNTPSPRPLSPQPIEPVPVPVAVPIPIYSVNVGPTNRPNLVSFVPTTPEPNADALSKTNPIYYEYFEAKRQQGAANVIDDFLSTTVKPQLSSKPIKLYATSKRPFKSQGHHANYVQRLAPNHRYVENNVVVITPKPEIRYKPRPIFKQRPLQSFEQEVNAVREALRYYQNQELRDNNIPRTPKAKPVYDYNYDNSKTEGRVGQEERNNFQPPAEFDEEPFKPMVTYSPSVNDENAFRALPVDKVDAGLENQQLQGREDIQEQPKYSTTTTLIPVQPQGRPKKLRIGAKYLQQPQLQPQQQQQQQEYSQPPRPSTWVAVNKQEFQDYDNPPQRERYQEQFQQPVPILSSRNRDFSGYYYGPGRQNNRFYEEPFQNTPNRKIVNYRPPQPQLQQQDPHQQWSLENDTVVNNDPQLPYNPDAEWIDPYRPPPFNNYQQQRYKQHPALSHQSQYYAPPPLPPQRLPGRQYQQPPPPPPPPSLYGDTLVNYQTPLPPLNPDAEYISHPNVVRNQPQQFYRSNTYQRLPQPGISPPLPINLGRGGVGGDSNVYYLTPKYRRANNLSNNNNNNNNRNYPQNSNSNNNGK